MLFNKPPQLKTERLILRPFRPSDTVAMFDIFSNAAAMRYMPSPPHVSLPQTQLMLAQEIGRSGAHYWSICLKENQNTPIGSVHFLGEVRIPGLGYIIHPDYWGQGYTPEACRAALNYGFSDLGYERVELWINEFNVASQRVAQKLGFPLRGHLSQKYPHETEHHTMFVYGRTAADWRDQPPVKQTKLFHAEPVLMVHDILQTAQFYRDKLGFHIDFIFGDPADHAAVSRGEWTGAMVTIQMTRVPQDQPINPHHTSYLYLFTDTSLDDLCEEFRQNGIQIELEPTSQPWGMREFVIRDLNQYRLVFATHI